MTTQYPEPTILSEAQTNSRWPAPKSIIEREYKTLFLSEGQSLPYINAAVRSDLYYNVHLSGVAIVGLAPSHPIITNKLEVINFKWKKLGQDGQIQLSGKRKVGAPTFSPDDTVCVIECKDGQEFHIKPYVRGRLAETNSNFQQQPLPVDPNAEKNNSNSNNNKGKGKGNNNNNNNNNNKGKGNKQHQQQQQQQQTTQPAPTSQDTVATTTTNPTTNTETIITTTTTTMTDQPRVPQPQQIYDPALLEQYKLLHEDPSLRGYLCMFLVSPEQMQLMIRLFLSKRDWAQLMLQRARFEEEKIKHNIDFSKITFTFITKALALTKPAFIRNHADGGPMLVFKKGEFKGKSGYKNIYQDIDLIELANLMTDQQVTNTEDSNTTDTSMTDTALPPPVTTMTE